MAFIKIMLKWLLWILFGVVVGTGLLIYFTDAKIEAPITGYSADDLTDGPHIFLTNSPQLRIVKLTSNEGEIIISDRSVPEDDVENLTVSRKNVSFSLNSEIVCPPARLSGTTENIFVVPNPRGNLEAVITLLKKAAVVDAQLNWIFENGSLVAMGDFLGQGVKITETLWLFNKLACEAKENGGEVVLIPSQENKLFLEGKKNKQILNERYGKIAAKMNLKLSDLFGADALSTSGFQRSTFAKVGRYFMTTDSLALVKYKQEYATELQYTPEAFPIVTAIKGVDKIVIGDKKEKIEIDITLPFDHKKFFPNHTILQGLKIDSSGPAVIEMVED